MSDTRSKTKTTTTKTKKPSAFKPLHVVAFSATRDIWYGTLESSEPSGPGMLKVTLTKARHCYYYAAPDNPNKGVGSLGSDGPAPGSKIGATVKRVTMVGCCGLIECSDAAIAVWERATWG